MKKIVLTVAAVIAMAAAAQATIVGSKHDLSGANAGVAGLSSGSSTELCAYCHTPHNPVRNVPLWNRNNPSNEGWSFYNSPTLTVAARGAQFGTESISLFCMSCHDGVTTMGAIKNNPQSADPLHNGVGLAISAPYANIGNAGKNLTNDHPVGFSYADAQTQDATQGTGGLRAMATVNTSFGVGGSSTVFFNSNAANGTTNMMECASCHKVHEPGTSGNFLRIENGGSNLCLACHNK